MSEEELAPFLEVLRAGGVVACPTETQMGLLADALDGAAVERVVRMKGRGPEPIGVIVAGLEQALALVEPPPERAVELARAHWPGPLTLVLRARPGLPAALLQDGKLGLRVPGPSPALALVRAFGRPLTATSANLSGQPPIEDAAGLRQAFGDQLGGVVPGRPGGQPASTVLDASGETLVVLRPGPVVVGD
ncbi:MAG: L-threonylcarbamoyladenylate synthase [Myxococcales bacterium]|nr:L-threonylcarbamoyladenylate synthase [Myxococcales bacterium]